VLALKKYTSSARKTREKMLKKFPQKGKSEKVKREREKH